jgi:hypothetical protein
MNQAIKRKEEDQKLQENIKKATKEEAEKKLVQQKEQAKKEKEATDA